MPEFGEIRPLPWEAIVDDFDGGLPVRIISTTQPHGILEPIARVRRSADAAYIVDAANEYPALKAFWDDLCDKMFEGIEGQDIIELALDNGLLVQETFDPAGRHEGLYVEDVEAGDLFYLRADVARRLDFEGK